MLSFFSGQEAVPRKARQIEEEFDIPGLSLLWPCRLDKLQAKFIEDIHFNILNSKSAVNTLRDLSSPSCRMGTSGFLRKFNKMLLWTSIVSFKRSSNTAISSFDPSTEIMKHVDLFFSLIVCR